MKQIEVAGRRKARRNGLGRVATLLVAAASLVAAAPVSAQVQPIVATTTRILSANVSSGPAVTDACGNVYVNASGTVYRYAAGTYAASVAEASGYSYGGPNAIAIDSSKTHLYTTPSQNTTNNAWYSSTFYVYPITNCTLGGYSSFPANGVSYLYSYYFGTANTLATDGYGDVFFTTTDGTNKTQTIAMISCGTTVGASCNGAQPTGSYAQVLTGVLPAAPTSLAGDSKGNLFFVDGASGANDRNIYEIVQPTTSAARGSYTPVVVGTVPVSAVAVSFDPQGNLYITDSNGYNNNPYYSTSFTAVVYEVPLESGTLNFSHMFVVANGLGVAYPPAVDASGNLFYTSYPPNPSSQNLYETQRGAASFAPTSVGTTQTGSVSYAINAATTIGSVSAAGSQALTLSGVTGCAAGAYAAGTSCTVNFNYKATLPGAGTGTVRLLDTSSNGLNRVGVSTIGLGSGITVDRGSLVALSGSFQTPKGATVDSNGNAYVADAAKNTITEFIGNSTSGTPFSTGTVSLSGPSGVAVDPFGNVFIADTGNNRIVQVPAVKGVTQPASTAALSITVNSLGLSSPSAVATDATGNLYIADTGNNRVVFVPYLYGALVTGSATTLGTGFSGPLGIAVDTGGNVFVADTGNGAVVKLSAPLASNAQLNVATGLSGPSAVAVDASGSLFVVNKGTLSVERFPLVSGLFGVPTYVGGTIAAPYGVAVDSYGNLIVTDSTNGTVTGVSRVQPSLNFGNWNVNATSTPQTATINNSGNAALTFASPDYTAGGTTNAGFAVTNDACSTAGSIVPGGTCAITTTFTPNKAEVNATETLTLNSNAVNGASVISLIGTGETVGTTATVITLTAPASGTLSAGVAATFAAVVTPSSGTTAPTGYVTFYVNGSQSGPQVPLTKSNNLYQVSLTFPNGLPAGSVQIVAVYSGDTNYSGSQASISETVVGLNAALTVTATTPYTNPQSANDNPANSTGPAIPLTATLAVSSNIIPTGTVRFYSGTPGSSSLIGQAPLTPTAGGYTATVSETALRAISGTVGENNSFINNYSVYAVYSGDNYYVPETSTGIPLVLVGPPTTQALCAAAPGMTITQTALSGGVGTFTYTISSGISTPAAGDIINITGTTNAGGQLNVYNVAIASVGSTTVGSVTTTYFTVTGFNSSASYATATELNGKAASVCAPNTTGATFTISPANPTITVTSTNAGPSSGLAILTVTSYGGWTGVLNFTCSNLPKYATCSPYPGAPLISDSTPSATQTPTQVQFFIKTNVAPIVSTASSVPIWTGLLLGLLLLLTGRKSGRAGLRKFCSLAGMVLLMTASLAGLSGCGSSSSSVTPYVTPAGTYAINVAVSAAQLDPTKTDGTVLGKDVNTGSFTINLTVK
jgi:sugar lactone lactonase YvrE